MYDPEYFFDHRLAAEFAIYGDVAFRGVPKGDETEAKFLAPKYTDIVAIRSAIAEPKNRLIDPRSYSRKNSVLVTLNLDTKNRDLWRQGYSARVRFAFNPQDPSAPVEKIDISVKTLLPSSNIIYLTPKRGEWEAELTNLTPDLYQIHSQNQGTFKKGDTPPPDFIKKRIFKPQDLFVQSVGCCIRSAYLSAHQLPNQNFLTLFEHTEDVNLFTTPWADQPAEHSDLEAEAELKGFLGGDLDSMSIAEFLEHSKNSVSLTSKRITNASPTISLNGKTKSERATQAVIDVYRDFSIAALDPVTHALAQGVRPKDVKLQNIAYQIIRLQNQTDRELPAIQNRAFG